MIKVAVPTQDNKLAEHFGRCEKYSFFEIENNKIVKEYQKVSPEHAPNVIPKFLKEEGTDLVITSGIGKKAMSLFDQFEINVLTGCSGEVDKIIEAYLQDTLETGDSTCNHEEPN